MAVNTAQTELLELQVQPGTGIVGGDPSATDAGATTRYLGSKARVAGAILDLIGPAGEKSTFVDALAGTGVVGREAAIRGWQVRLNDHLLSSAKLAAGNLYCDEHVPFAGFGGYEAALEELNESPPVEGFIWRQYSPISAQHATVERRYFTVSNAAKIDGIRARIRQWSRRGRLTDDEASLLIADLLVEASRVANTAGTFGCFLRHWQQNALQEIRLRPRRLLESPVEVEVLNRDVFHVPVAPDDVVYLDPPYTKRQYAAYYHVLETIAHGDEPEVSGVTGLRPWQEKASDFCYRRRALQAIERLVQTLNATQIFLSYSSQGHVELNAIRRSLSKLGSFRAYSLGEIGRYTPNDQAREAGTSVTEYLIKVQKPGQDLL